jgi:azurin
LKYLANLRALPLGKRPGLIIAVFLGALMMLAAACSDEADPNATATPRPPDTVPAEARTVAPTPTATTVPTPAPTPEPGSDPAPANLVVAVAGEALEFDAVSFTVQSGAEVSLTFNNTSTTQQHNWVLVPNGTKDDVAAAGLAAGTDNGWLPVGDARVLAATALLATGETGTVEFTAPAAGTYQYLCTFPGHNITMFGEFVVSP